MSAAMMPDAGVPALAPGQVHLWLIDLDRAEGDPGDPAGLSAEELARAARYHFDHDRLRFLRRRAWVRRLAAAYLGIPPAEVTWQAGPHGKPALPGAALAVNWADSAALLLAAFGSDGALGVDLEHERPLVDLPALAARYFSVSEQQALLALPAAVRPAAFYHVWSQKEAFIKCLGTGLSFPLSDFDVSVDPAAPPALLGVRSGTHQPGDFWMGGLVPRPGFRAAVCIHAPGPCTLALFRI